MCGVCIVRIERNTVTTQRICKFYDTYCCSALFLCYEISSVDVKDEQSVIRSTTVEYTVNSSQANSINKM